MEFIWYPKCSTCIKANKHLKEKGLTYTIRHIVEQTPSQDELKTWIGIYNQGIKPFFNTSGQVYRQLGLKEKINDISVDEAVALLSKNGMLIKRPLLILENEVIIGYKKEVYERL